MSRSGGTWSSMPVKSSLVSSRRSSTLISVRDQFRTTPPLGTTLETCLTFVVEDGSATVDRVAYYEGEYSFNDGTAVEWSEG